MDSRSAAAEPNQTFPPVATWGRLNGNSNIHGPSTPRTPGASTPTAPYTDHQSSSPYTPSFDLLPLLFSQHQAQLLQYNKLISPGRGGGGGLQTTTIPGALPGPGIQAAPRSRSSSKVSNKDGCSSKQSPVAQTCNGTRACKNTERPDREGMTKGKEHKDTDKDKDSESTPHKMPLKMQPELTHPLPSRPANRATQNQQQSSGSSVQSSSVPSTPHQRARNFSFESREPSPTANQNHSPRSVYSEPNGGATSIPARQRHPQQPCPYETASVKFRRRIPYSLGDEKLEVIDLDEVKSRLSEDEERKLSTDMRELYDRLIPSPEVEQNRKKLVQKLDKIFNDEWPGHDIRVHLFGSSGNLLCSDDSDVDICITTNWKEMEDVCIIASLLKKHGMEKVVCISQAKVPIVKIWDPELKLACDMNVNNTLALENTRMVRTYVEIDDRVRPLAMVIKYWTRRRIINDAAFGGTLSSYTWICLIIAFLQLRDPPVLPSLHQCPHLKLPTSGGHKSDFADDLSRLRGFGEKNKSTLGELLFQFFRFYAHEFDYDNMALSVRLGRMIPKSDKNWHRVMNNRLCVEEPFNKERNLGNTADDFSFRGLHIELRRAFDLISAAKFDECCEQFVFPKEEPTESKNWIKPAPRPAIIRSSSQQHTGRGGRNGTTRGNRNNYRNGNSSRRASSSNAYENLQANTTPAALPQPPLIPPSMPAQELQWPQIAQHYHYPGDMAVLSNALFAQDRWQWYAQAQAHQIQQAQAVHAQRIQAAQSAERSRTNSFDQPPPLSAPLRPDYYVWPSHMHATLYHNHHAGFGTHPSSPSTATAVPEFRRSLHRSSATNESGSSSSGGTLRSQSQPASRGQTYVATTQNTNGAQNYVPRQANLSPFPAFVSDDRTDSDAGDGSTRMPDSPPEEDSAGYLGYFVADSTASPRRHLRTVPTLGDVGANGASRRRLSTEGPQSVLDRRLQRTSRSPSPLGHGRAISTAINSAPLVSVPFPNSNNRVTKENSPLVVNGSTFMPPAAAPSTWLANTTEDIRYDNPLHISQGEEPSGIQTPESLSIQAQTGSGPRSPARDRPLVVNGSTQSPVLPPNTAPMASFGQRVAAAQVPSNGTYISGLQDVFQGKPPDIKWQRISSRNQQAGIAPLDLAVTSFPEMQNLSPVYETRTPSPTALRERFGPAHNGGSSEDHKQFRSGKPNHKSGDRNGLVKDTDPVSVQASRPNGQGLREGGPTRTGKGEPEGGWQRAKSRKKQSDLRNAGKGPSQSEQPPKNESERKGG